ncbi:MAG: ABC transporter ATP-binding protein [Ectothiorhodospiraceae bacterium AqS1]|nr:ABC transporter ATP-binding protein [Ectothiorhodospiraceae bacterium AqS1]
MTSDDSGRPSSNPASNPAPNPASTPSLEPNAAVPEPAGETPLDDLLEAQGITKTFGDFKANDDVSLRLRKGEIHALLGENGAGKSTLVKIIYGSLQPDAGSLRWRGKPVRVPSPAAARELGIGMVFQHFSLFDALTVVENIALVMTEGFEPERLSERIEKVSAQYGLSLDPSARVVDLSVGERQRIEIVRCLLQSPSLLIMDEPTSVLTPQEADRLFVTLRQLAAGGCAVLYISHRLEEVKALCHRATVLRHGRVVAQVDARSETAASLARLMVGSDVHRITAAAGSPLDETMIAVNDLELPAGGLFGVALHRISLAVRAGEVVAIAGVAGNGQSELFEAISGERTVERNEAIALAGVDCGGDGISARRRLGAAFVPEERLGHSAAPAFNLAENALLTRHGCDAGMVARGGFVDRRYTQGISERVMQRFDVRSGGHANPQAGALSGGNLQKFVVGRELDRQPKAIVIHQPTWGVDAGAAALIRQALIDMARAGAAVLVISQDLDEIFAIADKVAVISRGELSDLLPIGDVDRELIGLLMAGEHETRSDDNGPNIVGDTTDGMTDGKAMKKRSEHDAIGP